MKIDQEWVSPIYMIDTLANERRTYLVPIKGPEDRTAAFVAGGLAFSLDKRAASFTHLTEVSMGIQKPTVLSSRILSDQSVVLYHPVEGYQLKLDAAIKNMVAKNVEMTTVPINVDGSSWVTFVAALKLNKDLQ